jgi:hypothetical protein
VGTSQKERPLEGGRCVLKGLQILFQPKREMLNRFFTLIEMKVLVEIRVR